MINEKTDKSLSEVFNMEESPKQEILPVAESKAITVKVDDDKLTSELLTKGT